MDSTSVDKPGGHGGHHPDWTHPLSTKQIIEKIKSAIWQKRPILGDIMQRHGNDTLYEYAQDFLDVNKSPLLDVRKQELIAVVEEILTERLGKEVATGVVQQLQKLPLVSTADHHGPITHPFFVNSNIISALTFLAVPKNTYQYLVDFSFASISINNTSFPRGICFHGDDHGTSEPIRLPIFPDKLKMGVTYAMRAFNREDIERMKGEVLKKERLGEITPGRATKIIEIVDTYFASSDVLGAPDFNAQITKINYKLWPLLFHTAKENKLSNNNNQSQLIYVEIETIVAKLLTDVHLLRSESVFYKLLFNKKYQALVLQFFNNLPGAFSLEKAWGTYLFWGVDANFHRVRLVLDGNKLASHDQDYTLPLEPQAIIEALQQKKIFPSMLLCYLMVSLYYGTKCLGGFSQVHDLTLIKTAWQNLLKEAGEMEESEAVTPVQTKELGGDGLVLSYLVDREGDLMPATGIDMIVGEEDTTIEKFCAIAKQVTLTDTMCPMLPEIYNVLYSQPDRDPELSALTSKQILRAIDFKHVVMVDNAKENISLPTFTTSS
ncbi:MAG: hypothetical protein EXS55_01885 [Candidatus Magasanikbacteria bacterium]|nr:hypothetical protein [Candidatus Magasanikbacteria bacterium]